mmetsp:Transcript_113980/g.322684  ORF Transcript_113980/g.322684 Transcript_113980/m.322684 type:complete len:957 (+) Transcript_113980:101-2971(+)
MYLNFDDLDEIEMAYAEGRRPPSNHGVNGADIKTDKGLTVQEIELEEEGHDEAHEDDATAGEAAAAPEIVVYGAMYSASGPVEQEEQGLTEEERKKKEHDDAFRDMLKWEEDVQRRYASKSKEPAVPPGTVMGTMMVIPVNDRWLNSRTTIGKAEANLVDVLNGLLDKLRHPCIKHKNDAGLAVHLDEIRRRTNAFGDILSRLMGSCYSIKAVDSFVKIFGAFARPGTGIISLYLEWLGKPVQHKRTMELRQLIDDEFTEVLSLLREATGHIVSLAIPRDTHFVRPSQEEAREFLDRELLLLEETIFRKIRLLPEALKQLPELPEGERVEVRLKLPWWGDELCVPMHRKTKLGELKAFLVEKLGFPAETTLTTKSGQHLNPGSDLSIRNLLVHHADTLTPQPPELRGTDMTIWQVGSTDEHATRHHWFPGRVMRTTGVIMVWLLYELREKYRVDEFQETYRKLRQQARPGEMAHVDCALKVQAQLLPKYGFEGTTSGVQEMRSEVSVHCARGDWTVQTVMKDIHRLLDYGEPLPKMPIMRPLEAPRFVAHQKDRWLRHLADEGFVVVAGVANEKEVAHAYNLLWNFIELTDKSGKVRREDPSTWQDHKGDKESGKQCGWPAGKEDGILHSRGIGQSEVLWYLRALPALSRVYADVWGTDQLVASFDGAGAFRPYGHNASWRTTKTNWHHVDQAHLKRGLHCIQGLITLKDATPETGGLVVVPGSHRFHGDILTRYRRKPDDWNFVGLEANDPILTEGTSAPRLVCARAGDLILWDSRTVHCNTLPLREDWQLLHGQDLIRAVAYICMTPAAWCSEETIFQRNHAFNRGVTTSHWPHEFHAMHVSNEKPNFKLTKEMQQLICPMQVKDRNLRSCAPKEGGISLLPPKTYRVKRDHVSVRRIATEEWGEPLGQLPRGTVVEGHLYGRWLRLASLPDKIDFCMPFDGEAWAPVDHFAIH